MVSVASTVRGR